MKIRKRFVVMGGTMIVVMIFAALGIAEAFGGGMFGCCHHFGPMGGGAHALALKRLDSKVKELNLTAAQQAKYDELRAHMKEQMRLAKEDRMKFREMVRAELAKDAPDVAALNVIMKKKIETVSGVLQDDLDLFASFYSTLDEGQKQKVAAGIRKRMAKMDACREER